MIRHATEALSAAEGRDRCKAPVKSTVVVDACDTYNSWLLAQARATWLWIFKATLPCSST